ncbi:MAG TPA: hypothetical protein VK543_12345 [Puia sp.]|nr:hypothetical protein [Puia sp.]
MGCRVRTYITSLVFLFCGKWLPAQRVLYSPFIENRFEVAGKVGNYYWVEKKESLKVEKKGSGPADTIEERNFEIYDGRMNLVNLTNPVVLSGEVLKEYIVCSDAYFDQLTVLVDHKKTNVLITRYAGDGRLVKENFPLLSLPFQESANSFLLSRSEDRSKILLLCFESSPLAPPRMHAILYDKEWRQLSNNIYERLPITQPLIQDDFTNYPVEFFSNSPLKVANDGQWVMMLPSRANANFALYHFTGKDSGLVYREIRSPIYSIWEDVVMSIDNGSQEVIASVLSSFRYPTLKNVEVVHYSMATHKMDFDSSYRFNTLVAYKIKDENLVHESFVSVPGSGFMLLKEYGKSYFDAAENEEYNSSKVLRFFFASNSISSMLKPASINKDGYTRYDRLGGTRKIYQRGDLCMFYFPAKKNDSCWSGLVNKEQITEFNLPWLSYLIVPIQNKLFLLYNSFFRNEIRYGNSTVLDFKGNLIEDEGLVYWKVGHLLNFQKARRISDNEMAIPYERSRRFGFAIIRF